MDQSIIQAIRGMKLISLTYKGIDLIIEPHAYGLSAKGNELLRCYQIQGDHTSSRPHNWDLLTVSKIETLNVLSDGFASALPDYKRDDKHIPTIYAQL